MFFDQGSNKVSHDFYKESMIYPKPVLNIIADRLLEKSHLKIQLVGYFDAASEAGQDSLAKQRMANVYAILVDSLGVPSDQVAMLEDYEISQKRIDRASDYMVNAENRRVEIYLAEDNLENELELFAPLVVSKPSRLKSGIMFTSELKPFIEIVDWQLIIKDANSKDVVFRSAFKIEPQNNLIDWRENIYWVGNNLNQDVVDVNKQYLYYVQVHDKLGREFKTSAKTFTIECDSIEEHQEYIFLNSFDTAEIYFEFEKARLKDLAEKFCEVNANVENVLKCQFFGYACEIGDFNYNLNLAHLRAEKFRNRFIKLLRENCDQFAGSSSEIINDYILQNLTKDKMKELYQFTGHPGKLNEPIKYCNPCTLREISFPSNLPYKNNLNRRVNILFYTEKRME